MQLTEGRQQAVLEIARHHRGPARATRRIPERRARSPIATSRARISRRYRRWRPTWSRSSNGSAPTTWSPHGQSVRFDLTELMRPATGDLVTMIATLYPMGLIGAEECARSSGWGRRRPISRPGRRPCRRRRLARPGPGRAPPPAQIGAGPVRPESSNCGSASSMRRAGARARSGRPLPSGGVDEKRRTISGLVVPWDIAGPGERRRFPSASSPGARSWSTRALACSGITTGPGRSGRRRRGRTRPPGYGRPSRWRGPGTATRRSQWRPTASSTGSRSGPSSSSRRRCRRRDRDHRGLAREVSLVTLPAWASARVGLHRKGKQP